MYLKMDKQKEDPENVWYLFRTDIPGETYLNDRGIPRVHIIEKQGLCVFNKKTEYLVIDWSQTDDYFKNKSLEPLIMRHKLIKHNKGEDFPTIIDIATG